MHFPPSYYLNYINNLRTLSMNGGILIYLIRSRALRKKFVISADGNHKNDFLLYIQY